jgi:flagellar motor switch protein FliN/FliY
MAAEPEVTDNQEVDALLRSAQAAGETSLPADTASIPDDGVTQGDVEILLQQAERAIASIDQPADDLPPGVKPFEFADFAGTPASAEAATLELVRDVQLDMKIELGRTHMHLEEILKLKKGAVVPLDKLAGDPVDVFVNGRLIARGEVLVLNDNFCVRVTELVAGESAA